MNYRSVSLFLLSVVVQVYSQRQIGRFPGFKGSRNSNRGPEDLTQYSQRELRCFNELRVFFDNKCYDLLTKGPCNDGEWLVLDEESAPAIKPKCNKRPCGNDHALWAQDGRCHDVRNQTLCSKQGTTLSNDYYGMGSCECTKGTLKGMHTNGACYVLYSRGPCNAGFIFADNSKGVPQCQRDPCAKLNIRNNGSTFVYWPATRQCYPLESNGPCENDKVLRVAPKKRTVECYDDFENQKLVDVPAECDGVDHNDNCVNDIEIEPQGEKYLTDLILSGKKRKRDA